MRFFKRNKTNTTNQSPQVTRLQREIKSLKREIDGFYRSWVLSHMMYAIPVPSVSLALSLDTRMSDHEHVRTLEHLLIAKKNELEHLTCPATASPK